MLSPIQRMRVDGDPHHTRLVHESYFDRTSAVVTVVASLTHQDPADLETVTEWRVYWHAFGGQYYGADADEVWLAERVRVCAAWGTKLPEEIARAMFDIEGPYAR